MKCTEVKENLNSFLDGEIDLSAKTNIESHLENCVSCEAELGKLQTISQSLKQTLPITTNALFDEKMLNAFESFHAEKQTVKEKKQTKTGWFGIPKFAFATAFLLLALFSGLSFQIGRISASNLAISIPQVSENNQTNFDNSTGKETPEIKIVEVPIIKEKIVEVPVIKEKIIIRTVYVDKKEKSSNASNSLPENNFALNSSVKDSEFLTTTNLEGFQPVAEIKAKITKKEVEK